MAMTLREALDSFDRAAARAKDEEGERLRLEIVARFPLDGWPTMPLERYALGQADQEDTYSQWLEYKSIPLGSMKGGSSVKHIIYKHKDTPGWYFPTAF